MVRMKEATAIPGRGLQGDRYCEGTGYYSRADPCEVTIIAGEVLDRISAEFGVNVHQGEHRRNLVTRGLDLAEMDGYRFQVGQVLMEYVRPRPPCSYVQRLTEPKMTRALGEGPGICARVLTEGTLHEGDKILLLDRTARRRRLP